MSQLERTTTIQVSLYSREELSALAREYQKDERLTRRPTMDDVIRRLLAAHKKQAAQDGGRP